MKIVILYKNNSGCDYHRLILPYSNFPLQEGDSIAMFENKGIIKPDVLKDADFIIYNRVCPFDIDILIKWREAYNYKYQIVCDLDDYWYLNVNHEYYGAWKKSGHSQKIEDHIKLSDLITVTHESLAKEVKELDSDKEVYVFPNSLPYDTGQFTPNSNTIGERFKIVYTGGTSHGRDIKLIERAVERVRQLPIDFIIAGYNEETMETANFWVKLANVLRKNPNVYFKQALPLDSYMNHLSVANLTIAPLEATTFSWGKSPLKILESGAYNRPIICSDTAPYSEFRGVPGVYLCNKTSDWSTAFTHFSRNPDKVIEEGLKLGQYVRQYYNLQDINKKRYQFLSNFVNK